MDPRHRLPNPVNVDRVLQFGGLFVGLAGVALTAYSIFRDPPSSSDNLSDPLRSTPDRRLQPGEVFLLLGDSIGEGIQLHLNKLSNDYGSTLTSHIKRGATAAYWNQQLSEAELGFPLTILSLGTNDVAGNMTGVGPAPDELIAKLQGRGSQVVWFLPPSFRIDSLSDKQAQFAALMTERGVALLNLVGPQPSVAQDPQHVHLSPDGYRTLAAQVFDAIT